MWDEGSREAPPYPDYVTPDKLMINEISSIPCSEPMQRTVFVTIISWFLIIISGAGIFIWGFSTIFAYSNRKYIGFNMVPELCGSPGHITAFEQWFASNIYLLPPLLFMLSILSLVAAICLLKRKYWARIYFISLISLTIFITVCSWALIYYIAFFYPSEIIYKVSLSFAKNLPFLLLLSYVLFKLNSSAIRQEFKSSY
jgi:hypothetical protein